MSSSLLSVLFLGLVPVSGLGTQTDDVALKSLSVAPPALEVSIAKHLSASGVLVLDAKSGQLLYQQQGKVQRPMASLTKLMTALIIVENHAMDEWIKIPYSATQIEGSRAYLPAGELYTVGDVLSALLIASANDAAETLAVYHSGSSQAFVEEMNERAKKLGLSGTHFANPSGLDHPEQRSTPQDLAWLTMSVLRKPEIASRMGTPGDRITSSAGTPIQLTHTHALLHSVNPVMAGKTGTTTGAGECLVSLVEEDTHEYVVVLMQSNQRYADMRTILDSLSASAVPKATASVPDEGCEGCASDTPVGG